jgi:hypothetical protein
MYGMHLTEAHGRTYIHTSYKHKDFVVGPLCMHNACQCNATFILRDDIDPKTLGIQWCMIDRLLCATIYRYVTLI